MIRRVLIFCSLVGLSAILNAQENRTVKIHPDDSQEIIIQKAASLLPTANQFAYKQLEFTCFIHFGPNTFTRKEWGNGFEDPKIFNLQNLDTDQWCETAKAAGMKLVVITAKHHDGFCLWQSRYTKHGVMSSPFRNGKGDVLKDLSESCAKYGLKLGVYLSPADLFQIENEAGIYGNLSEYTERTIPHEIEGRPFANKTKFMALVDDYNEYFMNQLFELLTEYGPIHEVWFDGAHPKRKGGQTYNYLAWKKLIKTLAPEAVIFGKEDVRWCGNESGKTRESEWDIVYFMDDPGTMNMFPDMHGDLGSREAIQKAKYLHYLPAETNTSIREGWFYRDEDKQRVRSADDVFDMYERSVGGNSTFLLNIPPNRLGKFSDEDVSVLKDVGQRISETYGTDLLEGAKGDSEILDENPDTYLLSETSQMTVEIHLDHNVKTNRFVIQEANHKESQRIEKHALDIIKEGKWSQIAEGSVVGYKKILRFPEVETNGFRVRVLEARSKPSVCKVSAHYYSPRPPRVSIQRDKEGSVKISLLEDSFSWKKHGIDFQSNLNEQVRIFYTTNGMEPSLKSAEYTESFVFEGGEVMARAFNGNKSGATTSTIMGIIKKGIKATGSHKEKKHAAAFAMDEDLTSYWVSQKGEPYIEIELIEKTAIRGFKYSPPQEFKEGMIEYGEVAVSVDGKNWKKVENFEFGNLINDPSPREFHFKTPVDTKYFRIKMLRGAGGGGYAAAAEIDLLPSSR